jgi:glucokinase
MSVVREADPLAVQAFTDVGNFLGRGLADLVMCLDPEAVVLAGGVSAAGELLRAPTEASLRRCLVAREHIAKTSVVLGSLGAVAGAVGVAHLAALQTDVSAP